MATGYTQPGTNPRAIGTDAYKLNAARNSARWAQVEANRNGGMRTEDEERKRREDMIRLKANIAEAAKRVPAPVEQAQPEQGGMDRMLGDMAQGDATKRTMDIMGETGGLNAGALPNANAVATQTRDGIAANIIRDRRRASNLERAKQVAAELGAQQADPYNQLGQHQADIAAMDEMGRTGMNPQQYQAGQAVAEGRQIMEQHRAQQEAKAQQAEQSQAADAYAGAQRAAAFAETPTESKYVPSGSEYDENQRRLQRRAEIADAMARGVEENQFADKTAAGSRTEVEHRRSIEQKDAVTREKAADSPRGSGDDATRALAERRRAEVEEIRDRIKQKREGLSDAQKRRLDILEKQIAAMAGSDGLIPPEPGEEPNAMWKEFTKLREEVDQLVPPGGKGGGEPTTINATGDARDLPDGTPVIYQGKKYIKRAGGLEPAE